MASLFDPKCGAPTYTLTNEADASMCGRYSGWIFVIIVDIILFVIIAVMYFNIKEKERENPEVKQSYVPIYICLGLILLSFLFPTLFGFFTKRSWQATQVQIDGMISRGYTKERALAELAQNERTKEMVGAMDRNTYANAGLLGAYLVNNR